MKLFVPLVVLATFLLAGCYTQYQEAGFSGGFAEKQFSRNEFAVGFTGNGYTTGQRAVDLCLLRCAELTLGHGFNYFILTANSAGYDTSSSLTIGNYVPTGNGGGVLLSTTQSIPKPSAANRILCFREKPSFVTTEYFVAQSVFDELSQKYGVHKSIETFPRYRLPVAMIGVKLEKLTPHRNQVRPGGSSLPTPEETPYLRIESFLEGSLALEAGLSIGDEIRTYDGVAISETNRLNELAASWQIGQVVQVSLRRGGSDLIVPVKTIFNPTLRFNQTKDIKCNQPVSEKDVIVFEGTRPSIAAYSVADYTDWENPLDSIDEIKRYVVAAAVNHGVNGVLILNSKEEIKNLNPNADGRASFLCSLLIVPKARVGVEFETGVGYENRRIVRRVLNSEADGLHIGDNILAINGIDLVLNSSQAMRESMKWQAGQEVQVTVSRDGKELTFPVKTIENRL